MNIREMMLDLKKSATCKQFLEDEQKHKTITAKDVKDKILLLQDIGPKYNFEKGYFCLKEPENPKYLMKIFYDYYFELDRIIMNKIEEAIKKKEEIGKNIEKNNVLWSILHEDDDDIIDYLIVKEACKHVNENDCNDYNFLHLDEQIQLAYEKITESTYVIKYDKLAELRAIALDFIYNG